MLPQQLENETTRPKNVLGIVLGSWDRCCCATSATLTLAHNGSMPRTRSERETRVSTRLIPTGKYRSTRSCEAQPYHVMLTYEYRYTLNWKCDIFRNTVEGCGEVTLLSNKQTLVVYLVRYFTRNVKYCSKLVYGGLKRKHWRHCARYMYA